MHNNEKSGRLARIAGAMLAAVVLSVGTARAGDSPAEAAFREAATAYLRGDYRVAARGYESALELMKSAPEKTDAKLRMGAYSNLGTLYWIQGRYAEAEAMARSLLELSRKTLGPTHPDVAQALNRLGAVLRSQGRYDEAERTLNQALAILEPVFGVDHLYVAECLNGLAEVSRLRGEHDLAERRYWRAYMIRAFLVGPESSAVGETLKGLAWNYLAAGRKQEAETPLARALAIAEKPPRTGAQGWGRLDDRDLRELLPPERETVAHRGQMYVRTIGPMHIEYAQHYDHLADLYRAHGRHAEAEGFYRRSISIRSRAFGPEHPEIAQSLAGIALAQKGAGNPGGGVAPARQAAAVLAKRIEGFGPESADYARGERRRWRPVFVTALSLLVDDPKTAEPDRLAESLVLMQHANERAAGGPPVRLDELKRLLRPEETLVALTADEGQTFVFTASAQRAEVQRVKGTDPVRELPGELRSRKLIVVSENPSLAAGHLRLPSVDVLRTRRGL
jgi:tetratricopeptide (TPR) repeat protein